MILLKESRPCLARDKALNHPYTIFYWLLDWCHDLSCLIDWINWVSWSNFSFCLCSIWLSLCIILLSMAWRSDEHFSHWLVFELDDSVALATSSETDEMPLAAWGSWIYSLHESAVLTRKKVLENREGGIGTDSYCLLLFFYPDHIYWTNLSNFVLTFSRCKVCRNNRRRRGQ